MSDHGDSTSGSAPQPLPDTLPAAGGVLGQYRLLEPLEPGGMGQVFKAVHVLMDRIVAVKLIRPDLVADPEVVRRFHLEIRAVARLAHPHIVAAYDAAAVDGVHFLVMEYVEGITLARLVAERGPVPAAVACAWMHQTALGLQHAHECGLIHRDVKPSNLMVTPRPAPGRWEPGAVKLLDLGLAALPRDSATAGTPTPAGAVVGTPDYLAPEQARDARRADGRADLYSLGCTLYFLLTGRPPFPTGTVAEKLLHHQLDTPTPVEALAPDVPAGLAGLVRRLMARNPSDRPATAAAVADALAPFARPPAPPRRARAVSGRRRFLLAGAGCLLLLAVPVAWLLTQRPGDPPANPITLTVSQSLLDDLGAVARDDEFSWRPSELVRVLGDERWRHWDEVRALAVSPDGTRVASGGKDNTLIVRETATGKRLIAERQGHGYCGVAFSPDGEKLYAAPDFGPVQVWTMADGKEQVRFPFRNELGSTLSFALARDGRQFATGHADGTVRLWPITTRAVPDPLGKHGARVVGLAFSPDGGSLASSAYDGVIKIWDAKAGRVGELKVLEGTAEALCGVAFSPDGRRLAASGNGSVVHRWKLPAWEKQEAIPFNPAEPSEPAWVVGFSPDSKLLVAGGSRGYLARWDADTGKALGCWRGHFGAVTGLAFDPNGRTLFSTAQGRAVRRWDCTTWEERDPQSGHQAEVNHVAVSADGRTAVTGGGDGTIRLWDVIAARERAAPIPVGMARSVAVSSDGRLVAAGGSGNLKLWDAETFAERNVPGLEAKTGYVAFLPSAGVAAVVGTEVKGWHLATGKELFTWPVRGTVRRLTVAPSGTTLAVAVEEGGKTVVRLWDWSARQPGPILTDAPGDCLAFSADGTLIAVAGTSGGIRLCDVAGKTAPRILTTPRDVITGLAFARNEAVVAADRTGHVSVWGTDGKLVREWSLPGRVHELACTGDGRHLFTANGNGSVYVLRLGS